MLRARLDHPPARLWRAGRQILALAVALAAALGANAPAATAAPIVPESLVPAARLAPTPENRHMLFQKMLADPGNVDIALQYAELSSQAGDIEGAISTLERLLIFAPKLARLNFELGMLYFRLGSYDVASAYFKSASEAPDATPELKAQAAAYLSGADVQTAADRTLGSLMFGARYQSNANGGAGSPWIYLNNVPFELNSTAQADPDANGFAAATMHFTHDLQSQGDRLDADVNLYGSLYDKHDELNTLAGEVQAGPVFNLGRFGLSNATLGIHGIAGAVRLRGDPYLYTLGLGAVATHSFDPLTTAHARVDFRYEEFMDSDLRPDVSSMTGGRTRVSVDVQHEINPILSINAATYWERKLAEIGQDADWEVGVTTGVTVRFPRPIPLGSGPWSADLSGGLLERKYDTPDPTFSATDARHDHEAFVQGVLTVPIAPTWSAIATVGYRRALSNYGLYTYNNASGSLAVLKSF